MGPRLPGRRVRRRILRARSPCPGFDVVPKAPSLSSVRRRRHPNSRPVATLIRPEHVVSDMVLVAPPPAVGAVFGRSLGEIAALGGTIVLILMVVAMLGIAYKSFTGDGIEWPDDVENEPGDDGVSRGDDEDEWDYY